MIVFAFCIGVLVGVVVTLLVVAYILGGITDNLR